MRAGSLNSIQGQEILKSPQSPTRKTTSKDIVNLYQVVLGRRAESQSVIAEAKGNEKYRSLQGFLASSEFHDKVFIPIMRGSSWDASLFTTEVTSELCSWISSMFELDDVKTAYISTALSWPAVVSSLFSNEELTARTVPSRIIEHLGEFQARLAAMDGKINDDADLIADSDFFDTESYSKKYRVTLVNKRDAARHYLLIGSKRGYKPSLKFNPSFYLAANADVRRTRFDPLVHYIRYGRAENRLPRMSRSLEAASPLAPPETEWLRLAENGKVFKVSEQSEVDGDDSVDIIIPVYRGADDTLACIYSVLKSENRTPYRLLVIDDHSPEPELSRSLHGLAELGLITLLRNENNLGFVGTVNRGMMLSQYRDVILLNSDTEVYGNWIDRLRKQAFSEDRVATVTPLSNNATIFSYPHHTKPNTQTLEVPFSEIDNIAAEVNRGLNCIVPTGVGFCFYIRRAAINELGLFDEALFGKGYGEENDFCMRGIEHAWTNIAAFDVFVRHTGEVSFAANAEEGKRGGYLRLISTHPRYDSIIGRFAQRDPFVSARRNVDVARFAGISDGRGVLMIEHGWGGGIERHIADLAEMLEEEGIPSLVCTPSANRNEGTLRALLSDDFPNLPGLVWSNLKDCESVLRSLNLARVHIHSAIGLADQTVLAMMRAIKAAGLEYDFTIHDYAPICPRINMIDWSGGYCSSPSARYCRECISRMGTPFGDIDIDEWRARYKLLVNGARKIIVPNEDVAERLAAYLSVETDIIIRPHPAPKRVLGSLARPISGDMRRIGIIGAIGESKGSRILRLMCVDAFQRKLPIEFVLYGYTDSPERDIFPNLTTVGRYLDSDFRRIYSANPCDLAVYLSVWPETFSYTLDHAFNYGIYPVAFDLGAIARRIRDTGFGVTVPLDYMYDVSQLNDFLLNVVIPPTEKEIVETGRLWSSAAKYYDMV